MAMDDGIGGSEAHVRIPMHEITSLPHSTIEALIMHEVGHTRTSNHLLMSLLEHNAAKTGVVATLLHIICVAYAAHTAQYADMRMFIGCVVFSMVLALFPRMWTWQKNHSHEFVADAHITCKLGVAGAHSMIEYLKHITLSTPERWLMQTSTHPSPKERVDALLLFVSEHTSQKL
jgi:predicted Zn-dependent protease